MNNNSKLHLYLTVWWLYIVYLPHKIKSIVWHKYILNWWYSFWTPQDEFDQSLDIDIRALLEMNDREREKYLKNLFKRREIAHRRNLNEPAKRSQYK